jgi:hypothetical protein
MLDTAFTVVLLCLTRGDAATLRLSAWHMNQAREMPGGAAAQRRINRTRDLLAALERSA